MSISTRVRTVRSVLAFTALMMFITASAWAGETETVLYSFPGGANGFDPSGTLAMDSSGNLYGTTVNGGISGNGCGTVFELSPAAGGGYTETVLYTFQATSTTDGCLPYSGVTMDSAGNLYGTTANGGNEGGGSACVDSGCGTVYELVRGSDGSWTEKILWNFTYGEDGGTPFTNVVFDSKGNAYGTTEAGGNAECSPNIGTIGCGTVYKLTPTTSGEWNESSLVVFPDSSGKGGIIPGNLTIDKHDNLFGVTIMGGASNSCENENGCGSVFELVSHPDDSFTYNLLYQFANSVTDGSNPTGLVMNGEHLFGAAGFGGTAGDGAVWELSPSDSGWTESVLYNFQGGTDGLDPDSNLFVASNGALYGTTVYGGHNPPHCTAGCGTLFRVANSESGWSERVLVRFDKSNGNGYGGASVSLEDSAGNLYGVTGLGGSSNHGIVFELSQ
jgi:uncharacterized repeat protein (TIGR03803 family)